MALNNRGSVNVMISAVILIGALLISSINHYKAMRNDQRITYSEEVRKSFNLYTDHMETLFVQNGYCNTVFQGQRINQRRPFTLPSIENTQIPNTEVREGVDWGHGITLNDPILDRVGNTTYGPDQAVELSLTISGEVSSESFIGNPHIERRMSFFSRLVPDPGNPTQPPIAFCESALSKEALCMITGMANYCKSSQAFLSFLIGVCYNICSGFPCETLCNPNIPGGYFSAANVIEEFRTTSGAFPFQFPAPPSLPPTP